MTCEPHIPGVRHQGPWCGSCGICIYNFITFECMDLGSPIPKSKQVPHSCRGLGWALGQWCLKFAGQPLGLPSCWQGVVSGAITPKQACRYAYNSTGYRMQHTLFIIPYTLCSLRYTVRSLQQVCGIQVHVCVHVHVDVHPTYTHTCANTSKGIP